NVSILNKYDFAFNNSFDYYYIFSDASLTLFDSEKIIDNVFLATTKSNKIISIILFTGSEHIEGLMNHLNFVFDDQKLLLNTSINELIRQQNFWTNNDVSVFLSASNS